MAIPHQKSANKQHTTVNKLNLHHEWTFLRIGGIRTIIFLTITEKYFPLRESWDIYNPIEYFQKMMKRAFRIFF